MERKLGVINGKNIKFIRDFSTHEYTSYMEAQKKLIEFSEDQQLTTMVKLNYKDFNDQIDIYLNRFIENGSIDWIEAENMYLNSNRLILNYLSIIRTFLEHNETKLIKQYGKDSKKFKRFKDTCSNLYDNNFSYRFLYKLRNYAQHCGMPSGEVSIQSKIENLESKETSSKLFVYFKRDELLSNYNSWGNPLKGELEKLEANIEVSAHMSEMMRCVEYLDFIIIEEKIEEIIYNVIKMEQLLNELKDNNGTPCIIEVDDAPDDIEKLNFRIQWFPIELINLVKTSYIQNVNLD